MITFVGDECKGKSVTIEMPHALFISHTESDKAFAVRRSLRASSDFVLSKNQQSVFLLADFATDYCAPKKMSWGISGGKSKILTKWLFFRYNIPNQFKNSLYSQFVVQEV